MRAVKLTIQYDGANYNGWQIQPTGTTVQQTLQDAIEKITGENAKLIGAGRTDAGVHALAQVAAFKTSSALRPDVIQRALNANLPDDVRITDCCDMNEGFHPRYDAKSKIYFYIIANSKIVSPFLFGYAWHIPYGLDHKSMFNSLDFFKGRHDFSAFRGSGCGATNPVRNIINISIENFGAMDFMAARIEGDFIKIRVEADGFLRHMVRNIVGTIVEAGKDKIKPEYIGNILTSKDRKNAGPTAPAHGLFLEKVIY